MLNLLLAQSAAASNPLAELKPFHLPEASSAWPPAPGWWLLLLTTIVVSYLLLRYIQVWLDKRKQQIYRAQCLQLISAIQQRNDLGPHKSIAEVNEVLKRCAIHVYGRQHVSSLSGKAWLEFLQQNSPQFSVEAAQLLVNGPYLPPSALAQTDLSPLYQMAIDWISHHRSLNV